MNTPQQLNNGKNTQQHLSDTQPDLTDSKEFFEGILDSAKNGESEISLISQNVNKNIQLDWIEAIEKSIVALDNVIRTPSRYIEEREEVKPIELSRSIRPRSLIHLAQHTDYISKVEGDKITPNKILNIYNEETLLTYENRFVNTLVHRLYYFVNNMFTSLSGKGMENGSILSIKSNFNDDKLKGKVDLSISVASSFDDEDDITDPLLKRVGQLNRIISAYMRTQFITEMGDNFVRPPIQRTNALLKNKNLKQCLELWQFIESYDKVGYTIFVDRKASEPSQEVIDKLFRAISQQYCNFKHDITSEKDTISPLNEEKLFVEPLINTEFEEIDPHKFDIYSSEYRKIVFDKDSTPKGIQQDDYILSMVDNCLKINSLLPDYTLISIQKHKDAINKINELVAFEENLALQKEREQKEKEERELMAQIEREKEQRRKEREERLANFSISDIHFNYDKSFMAKLILAKQDTKEFYSNLKNEFLSYIKTKDRLSWEYDTIYHGRQILAKFRIKGKTLFLCFALTSSDILSDKFEFTIIESKKYIHTPLMMKINNAKKCKEGIELINILANKFNLIKNDKYLPQNYVYPYKDIDLLIQENLIKDLNAPAQEETADTEQVTENESTIDSEKVTENEQVIENEPIIDSEQATENEQIIDSEQVTENEQVIENELIIDSEQVIDSDTATDSEKSIDTEMTIDSHSQREKKERKKKGLFAFFRRK